MDEKTALGAIVAAIGLGYVLFMPQGDLFGQITANLPGGAMSLTNGQPVGALPRRTAESTPADMVGFHSGQWGSKAHVAIAPGLEPVWIETVLTGYAHAVPQEPVLFGDYIPMRSDCAATPVPGAQIVSLVASASGREMALMGADADRLYDEVDRLIRSYRETEEITVFGTTGHRLPVYGPSDPEFEVVDVVVPPSSQPLHLTLFNRGENLMWNFHVAEGADIRAVTLLGGRTQGVANLPEDVFIEAVDDAVLEGCDLYPWLQRYEGPEDNAPFEIDPEELARQLEEKPDAFRTWGMQFEEWYIRQFGQNPRDGIIGYSDVQVLVAGDPAALTAPLSWMPPSTHPVRLIENHVYITGDSATRNRHWDETVERLAEQKVGAPLESLHPKPEDAENG